MSVTVDCGQGRHAECTGKSRIAFVIRQGAGVLEAGELPFDCECRCHQDTEGGVAEEPRTAADAAADSANVVFIDTETTGLDPDRHVIWELAAIADGQHHEWKVRLTPGQVAVADPIGLAVGRFHERHPQGNRWPGPRDGWSMTWHEIAPAVARLTHGRHLAGACVSFDEERLRKALLAVGVRPSWHYHLVDVEALAAGWVAATPGGALEVTGEDGETVRVDATPPWDSEALSRAVGVDPDRFERHTALGDARWAQAMYEKVMGGATPTPEPTTPTASPPPHKVATVVETVRWEQHHSAACPRARSVTDRAACADCGAPVRMAARAFEPPEPTGDKEADREAWIAWQRGDWPYAPGPGDG